MILVRSLKYISKAVFQREVLWVVHLVNNFMYKDVAEGNNIHDFMESRECLAFPGRKKNWKVRNKRHMDNP